MTDKSPVPLNGRIVGFALAALALAVALRVAWSIIAPLIPTLLCLVAVLVVYRVMFFGRRR